MTTPTNNWSKLCVRDFCHPDFKFNSRRSGSDYFCRSESDEVNLVTS